MLEEKCNVNLGGISLPKVYLGAGIGKVEYNNSLYVWTMNSNSYTKETMENIKQRIKKDDVEYN